MDGGAWKAAVHGVAEGRTRLSDFTFTLYWTVNKPALCPVGEEGNGNPLQYSCLENPVDRETWWAAVHKVSQSQTRLSDLAGMHALENPSMGLHRVGCYLCGRTELEMTEAT